MSELGNIASGSGVFHSEYERKKSQLALTTLKVALLGRKRGRATCLMLETAQRAGSQVEVTPPGAELYDS
jgi:hypothetical protein